MLLSENRPLFPLSVAFGLFGAIAITNAASAGDEASHEATAEVAPTSIADGNEAKEPPPAPKRPAPQVTLKVGGLADEYAKLLRQHSPELQDIISQAVDGWADSRSAYAVEFSFDPPAALLSITDESPNGHWEHITLRNYHGVPLVDLSRARMLMGALATWTARTSRDVRAENATLADVLYSVPMVVFLHRTDTDEMLAINGARGGMGGTIVPPVMYITPKGAAPVHPYRGVIQGAFYFLEPEIGLDGQPSSSAPMYRFVGQSD